MNAALVRGLRRRLPDVTALQVGDAGAPPKGTTDEELLLHCQREELLFVTADRATVPACVHSHIQQGNETLGVFVIGPDASIGQILDELCLVYEESDATEWTNVIYYLPMFH
jgi:hypothetical protein